MKEKMIIIGFGMVARHFCEQFIKLGLGDHFTLEVFSKENHLAYDRVKLTDYARSKDFKSIQLAEESWYLDNGIRLHLGVAITGIDTKNKTVSCSNDTQTNYSKLIFATGSSPFVPPIPGCSSDGVFTYRTIEDANNIHDFSKGKKSGLVIGGGLLGIEAADFLQHQGLETNIVEMADFLMPRQLTPEASECLKKTIENKGFKVYTGTSTESIDHNNKQLTVNLKNGEKVDVDIVVISTGVKPNHKIAENAGIKVSPGGGIICDNFLQTSAEDVFAIGECVRHENIVYGLVAPGYKMADILAQNFAGNKKEFKGADRSTRLKLLGENVVSLGMALHPYKSLVFKNDSTYRMINLHENRIVGAIGIGDWPNLGRIQSAIENNMLCTEDELKRFRKNGTLWNVKDEVEKWPDETIICNCLKVTKGQILTSLKSCNQDIACLKKETGACTACGSCEPLIARLAGQEVTPRKKPSKGLLIGSTLSLTAIWVFMFSPVYWTIDSYDSTAFKISQTLKSGLWRQITGYSVLGFALLAALISVRKRFKFFSFGNYNWWRVSHGVFALISLIVLMAHTGFSSGKNINSWLFWTFLTMNFFGVITGFTTSFESYGTNKVAAFCRRWRRQITFIHFLVFWPQPVLITFHILQAYRFSL